MPAKLQAAIQVPSDAVPDYDEVLITSIITPVHYAKKGETVPSGNVDVGDTLEKNGADYIKEERYAVHYILLKQGVVVYKGHQVLKGAELQAAMTRNPNTRAEMKTSGYDVLKDKGIVPTNAEIV